MVLVGVAPEMIEISPFDLVKNDVSVHGSLTGTTAEAEDALDFSALQDIKAMIETMPLAEAGHAYDKMMRNEAKFRMVLTN